MRLQTCLRDPNTPLVIDASVAINLNATGFAPDIIRALPNRKIVLDVVFAELAGGRRNGRRDADLLSELVAEGLVEITTLGFLAEEIFGRLVTGGAAETLDDGEAATIAYAVEHSAMAIIDERKATRICGSKFPMLPLGCTIDFFTHSSVWRALGHNGLSLAVLNTLQGANMSVLPHHVEWVVELIGPEKAALCMSLPRSARLGGTGAGQLLSME